MNLRLFNKTITTYISRCGLCGDPFDMESPRAHELGGTYGAGVIVDQYTPGSVFTATVEITAYHKGYWYFNICPNPQDSHQECFDEFPVELEEGGTLYYPNQGSAKYTVNYRLPAGLVCDHCVLQWRYIAGNNWGVCSNGTEGLGCGNQEQFRACSDISIRYAKENSIEDEIPAEDIPYPLYFYLKRGYFYVKQRKESLKETLINMLKDKKNKE